MNPSSMPDIPASDEDQHSLQDELEPVPGMVKQIDELSRSSRYHTAMDQQLDVLKEHPNNQVALRLAGLILYESRTDQLRSREPVSEDQYFDPRLDPLFATCSVCKSSWTPLGAVLPPFFGMTVFNARALQCPNCHWTLCRNCYEREMQRIDTDDGDIPCKNCKKDFLGSQVLPTGRPTRQLPRLDEPIIYAIVYREGPIQPDIDQTAAILRRFSPDVLEDNALILGTPVAQWPDVDPTDMMDQIKSELNEFHRRGLLDVGTDHGSLLYYLDKDEMRCIIAKLALPPLRADILSVKMLACLREAVSELENDLVGKDNLPIETAIPTYVRSSLDAIKRLQYKKTIKRMMGEITKLAIETKADGKPHIFFDVLGDIALFVMVHPIDFAPVTRELIGESYVAMVRDYVSKLGNKADGLDIAAWGVFGEGFFQRISFSYLSDDPEQPSLLGVGLTRFDDPDQVSDLPEAYIYWFDWMTISEAGYPSYGRYVYSQVLELLAPEIDFGSYAFFFDGDALIEEGIALTAKAPEEKFTINNLVSLGMENCFALAIYGEERMLVNLHRSLHTAPVKGYLGKITFPGMEFKEFYELTNKFSLAFSLHLTGSTLETNEFGFISNAHLRELGYEPVEWHG